MSELNISAFSYVNGKVVLPMTTSKECRLHAEECLALAKQSEEFYVKIALIELAEDFEKEAKKKAKTVSRAFVCARHFEHRMSYPLPGPRRSRFSVAMWFFVN